MAKPGSARRRIAVIGAGISGLSAAWLLSGAHDVVVYERERRIGGHANTVSVPDAGGGERPVDAGFIVYNEATYPNLTALLRTLGVATEASTMSFAASLPARDLEYSGGDLAGLFAQRRNLLRRRFWSMLSDLRRFYRDAARDAEDFADETLTLGEYLDSGGYGAAFREDHLLPMASAIWSASGAAMLDYPARAFIRFHDNHGLLRIADRPVWRTVTGGSQRYVEALTAGYAHRIRAGAPVVAIRRSADGVFVADAQGAVDRFDDVVVASHADEALRLLVDPSDAERRLLGAFRYATNEATVHSDARLMPKRRGAWASWNYLGAPGDEDDRETRPTVTYWMNLLQNFATPENVFVTLNARVAPERVWRKATYAHPLFDVAALAAQRELWSLQGARRTWFCGAYFGAGFHEDGLQSGLAVAEALGGVRRPWRVENESGRIVLPESGASRAAA